MQAIFRLRCRGRPPNPLDCRDGPRSRLPALIRHWHDHAFFRVNLVWAGNGRSMCIGIIDKYHKINMLRNIYKSQNQIRVWLNQLMNTWIHQHMIVWSHEQWEHDMVQDTYHLQCRGRPPNVWGNRSGPDCRHTALSRQWEYHTLPGFLPGKFGKWERYAWPGTDQKLPSVINKNDNIQPLIPGQ